MSIIVFSDNSPREAAVAIAQHVNHRDQHVAILALTVHPLRILTTAPGHLCQELWISIPSSNRYKRISK